MKTPSRKILSVVLAVAVLASLLATSVFAGQRAVGVGAVTAAQSTIPSSHSWRKNPARSPVTPPNCRRAVTT